MASASHSLSEVKFIGPAQGDYGSMKEQARDFLDNYWPNWRNYNEPRSYVIPPVFCYKNPEISDEAIEEFRAMQVAPLVRKEPDPIGNNRRSDDAEYMVYNAIQQLAQDGIQAPFIAFHHLDIEKIKTKLNTIFSYKKFLAVDKAFREYDFLLIGPKIGMVVIEAKSSEFKCDAAFEVGSLPNGYEHGIEQLLSTTALLELIKRCAKFKLPSNISVRKILFAPNLEKTRYKNWNETEQLKEKTSKVIQWFKEDTSNLDHESQKPPLFSTLQELLCGDGNTISQELYEAYSSVLCAMASITVAKSSNNVYLNRLHFWEFAASLNEHFRITDATLVQEKKSSKATPSSAWKTRSKPVLISSNLSKAVFISRDQQKALNCPCPRQFILGVAGTGKTIVLQTKALELLAKGQSVYVLAQSNHMIEYERLFNSNNYERYKVWHLEEYTKHDELTKLTEMLCESVAIGKELIYEGKRLIEAYTNKTKNEYLEREDFWKYDHVIIDDGCDHDTESFPSSYSPHVFIAPVLRMLFAKHNFPKKVLWMAMDPYAHSDAVMSTMSRLNLSIYDDQSQFVTQLLLETSANATCQGEESDFAVTVFNQVMRCSKNIFDATYTSNLTLNWEKQLMPVLGHKVLGIQTQQLEEHYLKESEAKAALWDKIKLILGRSFDQKIDICNIALIINTANSGARVSFFLKQQLQNYWPKVKIVHGEYDELINIKPQHSKDILWLVPWSEVSSFEWPVVIYVCFFPANVDSVESQIGRNKRRDLQIAYAKYRAVSRATAMLICITVTFDVSDCNADGNDIQSELVSRMMREVVTEEPMITWQPCNLAGDPAP